jgi:hypothetical protein
VYRLSPFPVVRGRALVTLPFKFLLFGLVHAWVGGGTVDRSS